MKNNLFTGNLIAPGVSAELTCLTEIVQHLKTKVHLIKKAAANDTYGRLIQRNFLESVASEGKIR